MDKHEALERLAAIEVETDRLRKIIDADAETPDPRRAWIGKWGFYNDDDPECPDDFLRRLAGIDPGNRCGDFRLNNGVHWRYFRPATPEELGVTPSIEPDWSKAPEWARYWALDESGGAWWYEKEPGFVGDDGGWSGSGRTKHDIICTAWRDSLRKRPEATK